MTFMPLNREVFYFDFNPSQGVPLLSRLEFDPLFEPAMRQVFGKEIVVPDIAITVDGDRADRKSSGGWIDHRKSRLELAQSLRRVRADLAPFPK